MTTSNTATAKEVPTISAEESAAKLDRGEKFEFWNVFTGAYHSGENIMGSRHVPLDRIGREVSSKGFAKATEIVVYCVGDRTARRAPLR